jgi:hypothetical protein
MSDGVPWQVVAGGIGVLSGAIGWIGKRAWDLVEKHSERRTVGIEAIAPAIERFEKTMTEHMAEHARRHAEHLDSVRDVVVASIDKAKDETINAIGIGSKLDRLQQRGGAGISGERPRYESTLRGIPAVGAEEAELLLPEEDPPAGPVPTGRRERGRRRSSP